MDGDSLAALMADTCPVSPTAHNKETVAGRICEMSLHAIMSVYCFFRLTTWWTCLVVACSPLERSGYFCFSPASLRGGKCAQLATLQELVRVKLEEDIKKLVSGIINPEEYLDRQVQHALRRSLDLSPAIEKHTIDLLR